MHVCEKLTKKGEIASYDYYVAVGIGAPTVRQPKRVFLYKTLKYAVKMNRIAYKYIIEIRHKMYL